MTSTSGGSIDQILAKYPDRIPAYVRFPPEYKHMKNKYLIPREYTMGEFIAYMRNRMIVPAKYGLIVIVNPWRTSPPRVSLYPRISINASIMTTSTAHST